MGFRNFWKTLFSSEEEDDAELRAARARHGIRLETPEEQRKREAEEYDPWEDLRNMRSNMFLGTWLAKKVHMGGDDKVKADLDVLEAKKKQEEESRKREEDDQC